MKRYPYFKDYVSAIDGTHIYASIPLKDQPAWRNRKGFLSQNVLAACDFNGKFTYILAGWEGSAHDMRVLNNAKEKGFGAPTGKYFLADAGYSNSSITLTPYRGVRYHLREQAKANKKPETKEEFSIYVTRLYVT